MDIVRNACLFSVRLLAAAHAGQILRPKVYGMRDHDITEEVTALRCAT